MRDIDFLIEAEKPKNEVEKKAETLITDLKRDCKKFISNGHSLYRGARSDIRYFDIRSVRKHRNPKNISQEHTRFLNKLYKTAGYNIDRTNCIFAYNNPGMARRYGNPYLVFPIGEYNLLWNEKITDPWPIFDADHYEKDEYEFLFDFNEESIDNIVKRMEKGLIRSKETALREALKNKYQAHVESNADERIKSYATPETTPQERKILKQTLVNKWMNDYMPEIEKKIQEQLDEWKLSQDFKRQLEDRKEHTIKRIKYKYGKPNFERALDFFGPYFNDDPALVDQANDDNEILLNCDEYYVIEPIFFDLYIKDKIWH